MHQFDYSKISITAKLVAYFRQFSDIPFAQEVAEYVQAEDACWQIAQKLDDAGAASFNKEGVLAEGKIFGPLLEARYKSIVQVILKTGMKQVLETASGFSLRGLAMTRDSTFAYVESDLPAVNELKTELVADLRAKHNLADYGNHHIVTANALNQSEMEAASELLKRDQPIAVVTEGLIPYLSSDERSQLANVVRQILGQFQGGVWITPDFMTKEMATSVPEKIARFRKAIAGITDRQLHESAFDSEEAINDFALEHGFEATTLRQVDEVPHLTSVERLGLSSEVLTALKPRMRMWLLRPR